MKKGLYFCFLLALSLCACSKKHQKANEIVDKSAKPISANNPSMGSKPSSEPSAPPLKPAKQVEIIRDKDEVERLAQAANQADQSRKPSPDVSVTPTPEGVEAVYYKGALIFSAKHIERTDAHPNGKVMILAQLVGDAAVTKTEGIEYTEGQSLDPVGIWIFSNGQIRRITKPNGSVVNAMFSPNGKLIAVSEYVQNEHHENVSCRCFIVDLATGKSAPVGENFSGDYGASIGEWLSESKLRVFVGGEIFLEQAITYEIPSF